MFEDQEHYQDAKIIFCFWKFSIQKALDGSGAIWIVWRLRDGDENKREFVGLPEKYLEENEAA